MPIYTRTGDKGETALFNGRRISKDSPIIEAMGTVDELNSLLGVVISQLTDNNSRFTKELIEIQGNLFEIGAILANPKRKTEINFEKEAKKLEKSIDKMSKKLPVLRNFILPGGGRSGANLQFARTLARRTERRLVSLKRKDIPKVLIYINRLSDYLLTVSRFVDFREGKKEIIWIGSTKLK